VLDSESLSEYKSMVKSKYTGSGNTRNDSTNTVLTLYF